MGGCTSKQEISNTRSVKRTSSDQRRRRRRKELDERGRKLEFNEVKEAKREWRKERKKLQEEMKKMRNKAEETDYWKWVVEQLCVERAVRDEAIEKWKQLYLAIKTELDHLINTTSGDQALLQKIPEEEGSKKTVEELRKEVSVKEEIIESLKGRIALIDKLKYDKERETDLLKQSLRILGTSKKNKAASSYTSRNLLILKPKCVQCT